MYLSEIKERVLKEIKAMPPVKLIVLSFIVIIFVGTILLCLPFASKGKPISIINSLFTSTSATCVTGLSVFDTYSSFTFFGQLVILLLIQVGGLGLATFTTALLLLLKRKIGYKDIFFYSEAAGHNDLDIKGLLKAVLTVTFTCELIGALLLMIRFVPNYGLIGVWSSIFVSISAFCNAGFDVLGFIEGNSSVSAFAGDALVSFTLSGLIFIGSLGFVVIQDVYLAKVRPIFKRTNKKRLSFHSNMCIKVSIALLLIGSVFFMLFEYDNTLKELNFFEKIVASIFQSTNTRTAGFSSVNIGAEKDITKLLTMMLMFIGGSPGSTAGGIKVTTFVVIIATVVSTLRARENINFLNHRFVNKTVYKAITTIFLGASLVLVGGVFLIIGSDYSSIDAFFEMVSAFATVGLSAGITAELTALEKIVVVITMFIGRVGPASLGLAVLLKPRSVGEIVLPEGRTLIG